MSPETWDYFWKTLADLVAFAIKLGLVVAFVWFLLRIFNRGWRDLERFFRKAIKAELTEKPGWLNLALCTLFGACVLIPTVSELIFATLSINDLTADRQLLNSDLKAILMSMVVVASLIFVGLTSKRS